MTTENTIMAGAFIGLLLRQLVAVRKGIKSNPGSPDAFSFRYYFTRPLNVVNLLINAAGSWLLYLGREDLASTFFMGSETAIGPALLGGGIGLCGDWAVSKITGFMGGKAETPDDE